MMKKSFLLCAVLVACLASSPYASAQAAKCALTVHVDGFRNQKGDLGVTVFNSPDGWPEQNEKALQHQAFPFSGASGIAKLELPAGRYSIAVLHDENSNHKLDRNFLSIPKEGFGFSNNPKVSLSAPGFNAAAFQLTCPATDISIHLIYK